MPLPEVGRNFGGTHSAWSAEMRGSPRRSTGSSWTARMSRNSQLEIAGDLGNDLRLADAARAPDVQRHTFANQRMKRLIELRRFHEVGSFRNEKREKLRRLNPSRGVTYISESAFSGDSRTSDKLAD